MNILYQGLHKAEKACRVIKARCMTAALLVCIPLTGYADPITPPIIHPSHDNLPQPRDVCQLNVNVPSSFVKPEPIHPTNNLRRKNGEYFAATGHYIEFRGIVRDKNCVPIQNAIVHIWHRDHNGGHLAEYKAVMEDVRLHPDYDKHFGYSGVTVTDNRGYFSFISIMPGISSPADRPHVNISIQHDFFKDLTTRVYFMPNHKDGSFLYDDAPTTPFRHGMPDPQHPPGETATSDTIITPEKREGFRFFSRFVLNGKENFRGF